MRPEGVPCPATNRERHGAFADMVRLGEGREAEVFLLPNGDVLKLMRNPDAGPRAEREATAAIVANEHGKRAPAVREVVFVQGRPGLVMERAEGPDLLTRMGASPWGVWKAGAVMASVHAAMHETVAPESLPDLNDELCSRIETAAGLSKDLRDYALTTLARLPHGDRLCHGDFHLANILGTWDQPLTIDWADASRGDPLADVARTEIVHRIGDPPPRTGTVLRILIPMGRKIVVHRYLDSYRALRLNRPGFHADSFVCDETNSGVAV